MQANARIQLTGFASLRSARLRLTRLLLDRIIVTLIHHVS